jgi:arylsulfatase A-like enzyme
MKVIVLNLHGARLDAFGAYGSSWVTTPNFDRLAAAGVVFDQHYATHRELEAKERPAPEAILLGHLRQALRTSSIPSVLLTDSRVDERLWLDDWKYLQVMQDGDLQVLEQPTLADAVFQGAVNWIQDNGQLYPSWLVVMELGSLLSPWHEREFLPPPGEAGEGSEDDPTQARPIFTLNDPGGPEVPAERFGWKTAYSGVMHYVDDLVGQFLKLLNELELDNQCVVAVTSPEGQSLGERSDVPDRLLGLHEETNHLPLIVRLPGRQGAGRRVHQFTDPLDWGVTLFDLFKAHGPGSSPFFHYRPEASLFPLMTSTGTRLREYSLSRAEKNLNLWEQSLRSQDWYFVLPEGAKNSRPSQLYRKPEDRWEMNNVIKEHQDVADHLELTLYRYSRWLDAGRKGDPPALRDDIVKVTRS